MEKYAAESTVRVFVANKSDVNTKRKVTNEEGKEMAARYNVGFVEASAKSGANVPEIFRILSREIKTRVLPQKKIGAKAKSSKLNMILFCSDSETSAWES